MHLRLFYALKTYVLTYLPALRSLLANFTH